MTWYMGAKTIEYNIAKTIAFRIVPAMAVIGLSSFIVVSTLVGVFPETFGPVFGGLINYYEGGVYADCTLHRNRNNRICSGAIKDTAHNKTWNALQKGQKSLPFNLHK